MFYCRDEDSRETASSKPTVLEMEAAQPTIDLNISLSELWTGCSTVLVDVTPWCLLTNACQLDLVLMGAEDRSFQVPKGGTISPPRIEVCRYLKFIYLELYYLLALFGQIHHGQDVVQC